MRQLLILLTMVPLLAQTGLMRVQRRAVSSSWSYGVDFRDTSGHATDVGTNTYFLGTNDTGAGAYPISRGGINIGSSDGLALTVLDNAGTDPRFAGVIYTGPGQSKAFKIELPTTGTYNVRLAIGESDNGFPTHQVIILDNSTTKATITGGTSAAHHFLDATGVERTSESDWIANNVSLSVTFASTTMILRLGSSDYTTVAYVGLTK